MTPETTKAALADILASAQSSGLAHNNGAGGQYLLCATEPQLLKFAALLRANAAVVPWNLICQAIEKADDITMTADYMLDSKECIQVVRTIQVLVEIAAPSAPVLAEPGESENKALRRMLCAAYAGGLAYVDDGEAQDGRAAPVIDFLRDSVSNIQAKMQVRAIAQIESQQPVQGGGDALSALVWCAAALQAIAKPGDTVTRKDIGASLTVAQVLDEADRAIGQSVALGQSIMGIVAEWRDYILNGRGNLEGVLDNDQTNEVLAAIDDMTSEIEAALALPPAQPAPQAQGVDSKFFSFNAEDGFETHDTAVDAEKAASAQIGIYRDDCTFNNEWADEVEQVCWGVIMEQAKAIPQVGPEYPEEGCDYKLAPLATPSLPGGAARSTACAGG